MLLLGKLHEVLLRLTVQRSGADGALDDSGGGVEDTFDHLLVDDANVGEMSFLRLARQRGWIVGWTTQGDICRCCTSPGGSFSQVCADGLYCCVLVCSM